MSAMNFLIGYRTDDFVILASDQSAFVFGALRVTDSASKEYQLGEKLYMTAVGEAGDADNFGDWAKRNIYLYKLRHNYELSPRAAHHWLRKNIAQNLRTEDFWRVDLLLGGYDDLEKKAFLGSVDYLGTGVADQKYLFRGFGGRFSYAILDALYNPNASVDEALEIVTKCIKQNNKRFIAGLPKFSVIVIGADGVQHREIDVHTL